MANTYIQIYIQFVFAVQGQQNLIHPLKRESLQRYISGIIKNNNQKLLAIYANPDHIHILIGFNSLNLKIPDLIRDIKSNSSRFINEENWFNGRFSWQEGYGAFSYSRSITSIIRKSIIKRKVSEKNIMNF